MQNKASDRIRILLIAEACNPTWASESRIGYQFAAALAARTDLEVTLATHVRNRKALQDDPIGRKARLVFIDDAWNVGPIHRIGTWIRRGKNPFRTMKAVLAWFGYVAFERHLFLRFREQFAQSEFDLIHRVTPVSPTMGSPLASLVHVPMILGPLKGGLPWPKQYPELRYEERGWLGRICRCQRIMPYYRATYRHVAAVIVGSHRMASEIPSWFAGWRYRMPEDGIAPSRFPLATGWSPPRGRFRFITVGQLVPYKGMQFILNAMSSSPTLRACELWIVGEGPHRRKLETLVAERGLTDNVRFLGWRSQKKLAKMLAVAQAFVFPSLRESGGAVVLEAMASGLPCIVVAHGGPSELVSHQSGILVPLSGPETLILALRYGMEQLVDDPELCRTMGKAACRRVRGEFTWTAKAERLVEIYNEVLGRPPCSATEPSDFAALAYQGLEHQ